jgi:hypothetical protein
MQRRNFPLILLYGFGLALALSLAFNGFLLYEKTRRPSLDEYGLNTGIDPVDHLVYQQHLSDCLRAIQQKDSLIHQLSQSSNATPEPTSRLQRLSSK